MNSQEYWKRRTLYAKQKQLDHERDYELAMRARLQSLENEIIKEARHWISKYASENNLGFKEAAKLLNQINTSRFDMTLAEFEAKAKAGGYEKELNSAYYKSRIARLQKLQQQFIEFAGNYADKEEGIMAKTLADQYQFTYDQDNYSKYLVTGGIDVDYAHFNEDQLRSIVYQPWQGSDFSKRIWNNYTNVLPEVLTGTMFKATALGYSHFRIEQELRSIFRNVEDNSLHRLIVTEMGHITEQATADFYEDSNIEQYQYLATLETHTCEVCAHLDERIFYVKDRREGINYPMIHPYCRCTTVPYMKDLPDIVSRWSRDPETGKGKFVKVGNRSKRLTFGEWKKEIKNQFLINEYNRLIEEFGRHGFPNNSQAYINLLYNKRTGRALNAYVKARERGTVEPVVTYQDYIDAMDRLNDEVVGTTASNGQVVKDFSDHLIDRIFGVKKDPQGHRREGVSIDKIKELLQSAERTIRVDSTSFRDDDAYVVLSDKGNLVTIVPRKRRNKNGNTKI